MSLALISLALLVIAPACARPSISETLISLQDHNPPMVSQLLHFIERGGSFMETDKDNVLAVHCKGGKGRTGVVVASWLLFSQFCTDPEEAMDYFEAHRTSAKATLRGLVQVPVCVCVCMHSFAINCALTQVKLQIVSGHIGGRSKTNFQGLARVRMGGLGFSLYLSVCIYLCMRTSARARVIFELCVRARARIGVLHVCD